jgi:CDP-diacylglycerol--glycerol-3-phosphate 3-phosphatidyltransferase
MGNALAGVDQLRNRGKAVMTVVARGLNKATGGHLSPTAVTVVGFLMHFVIAWLIAQQHLLIGGLLLIFFGLFDALDGALARLQGSATAKGMFLDSVTDKMKEVLLYSAAGYALIASGHSYAVVWAIVAGTSALLVSYTNAWGEVALQDRKDHVRNQTFRTGLMTFDIRMLVLIIGLVCNQLLPVLVIIAIGSILTALSRLKFVLGKLDG